MRLRRLELQNFRNYGHLTLDFDQPRTLLLGENGTGKSTIFDAIQWLLTGQCRGVDGKGAGQKDLIKLGQDAMTVTGVFDTLGPVSRSIARNGSATSSLPVDAILGKLGVSAGMLATVLAGRAFFTMHHADAKALLMQLLNVRIPKDKLPGVDLPDSVADVDLGYLEQLYDKAFQDRKTLKATLAGIHVPDPPKVVQIDLGGKTLADVQKQLAADNQGILNAVRDQTRAEHDLQQNRNRLATAKTQAATVEQLRGTRTAHQDMLTQHQAQLRDAEAAVAAAEAEQAEPTGALEVQLREAASLIDKIERHTQATTAQPAATGKGKKKTIPVAAEGHACVLSAAIPCLTAISEFQGQVALLQSQQKNLEARIRAGSERTRKIAQAQQAVKESERHVTYHQAQVKDADQKIAAAEAAAATIPDLQALIDQQDAAVAAGAAAIDTRRAGVATLNQQVAALATYEQAQRDHAAAKQRKDDADAKVTKAEDLVTLLGPKGLRLQYLDAALTDFLMAINAALEPFGFAVAINVDPWRVEVQRGPGAGWVRFELLSTGQQLWTALAFQLTLAAMSGLEFAVLDDAQNVVGINRAVLTELILNAPVDQVLVAMSKADDEVAPDIDGLQVVRVGAGDTEREHQAVAAMNAPM